jgi:hypothetical protein
MYGSRDRVEACTKVNDQKGVQLSILTHTCTLQTTVKSSIMSHDARHFRNDLDDTAASDAEALRASLSEAVYSALKV